MSDENQRDELVREQLRAFGATLTATTAEPIRTAETPAPSGPGQRRWLLAVGVAASVIALLVGLSLFGGSGDDPGRPAGSAPTSTGVTGPRREPEAVGTDPLGLVADGGWRLAQRTAATVDVSATEARPALRELYVNSDESISITVHYVDGGTADGAGDVIRAVERVPGRGGDSTEALPDPEETVPANVIVRGHRVASSFGLIAVGGPGNLVITIEIEPGGVTDALLTDLTGRAVDLATGHPWVTIDPTPTADVTQSTETAATTPSAATTTPVAGPTSTVSPVPLTPGVAAELAAPGNADAVATLRRLPASATFQVAYCAENGCSSEPSDDAPDPAELVDTLLYADRRLLDELGSLGVALPRAGGAGPFFASDDPDLQRADVGFSDADIIRYADVRGAPRRTTVLDVAVTPAAIDTAVRNDPAWSPDLAVTDTDRGTVYDWNAGRPPFSQDLARTSPLRPLGVGGSLVAGASDEGTDVLRTVDPAVVDDAIAQRESILDRGPYATALAHLPAGRIVLIAGENGYMSPTIDRDDIAHLVPDRFHARVDIYSISPDGTHTDTYIVYPDTATAASNLERIIAVTRDGLAPDPTRPDTSSRAFPNATIEQLDSVIHINHTGFAPSTYLPINDPQP